MGVAKKKDGFGYIEDLLANGKQLFQKGQPLLLFIEDRLPLVEDCFLRTKPLSGKNEGSPHLAMHLPRKGRSACLSGSSSRGQPLSCLLRNNNLKTIQSLSKPLKTTQNLPKPLPIREGGNFPLYLPPL
ncbi:MAG: hypothetical protein EOP50_10805 [Sphingobacteriales bacterium]|nr:MAG: hypothetical protein EOP50_10805 [Sphingobacteriales bacterium]